MPNTRLCLYLATALAAFVPAGGLSQTLPQTSQQYIPLFTPQQIAKASERTRTRMQATEDMNRQAWQERRRKLAETKAKKEAEARAALKPAAPSYTRKGKIFKWVDAQGRTHFGDAPTGNNAQQIKLHDTNPPQGAPSPATAPHLQKSDKAS